MKLKDLEIRKQQLRDLLESLGDDNLTQIDFDQLTEILNAGLNLMDQYSLVSQELAVLKSDCQARIGGMVKAIAIADRQRQNYQQALDLTESLKSMNSAELIDCYARVAARFRDMFPVNHLKYLTRQTAAPRAEFEQYK
jgi:hypothetical protein